MNKKPLKKKEVINLLKKIKRIQNKNEKIDLLKSNNRVLADTIISKINVPPFNNSAVDGYALPNDGIKKIKKYRVVKKITAGDDKNIKLNYDEAARIFTGARMPLNSQTVVMQENTQKIKNYINIIKKPKLGDNCRLEGEDVVKNKKVLISGQIINTQNISLLASIGKKYIRVNKKLRVGYFTSGNELFNPTEKLSGSKINNSNRYCLHHLLNKNYIDFNYLGNLKDSKDEILKNFKKKISDYSVLITTGGASVGEEDHLVDMIKANGKVFFWKTAIKPGRPLAIGKIKNTIVICLPGNPVSVYLLYGMIVKPFLEYLCGSEMKMPNHYSAIANFSMRKKTERLEWLRVNIIQKYKNEIRVNMYPKQGSGMISSIAFTDGILEIPEEVNEINIGDKFNFYSYNDLFN